jgi:hypothetical protein
MAKTVAEIDGDSSGLVSSLDKAKTALGDLGTKGKKSIDDLDKAGKKLSDQLKDVADQADVAAGNLVNALGGPGAIKAIGGVGIAFAGAKAGVDAFLGSAESMFRAFGDEGQAVWDQVEKSLFAIDGAFAEAVLGSDDMYEAGGNLQAMFELVKEAVDAVFVLLKPLTVAFTGLLTLTTDYGDKAKVAADKLRQQAEAQTAIKTTGDLAATSLNTLREKMMSLRGETENLRDIQIASYQMDAKMTGERILQAERVQDEAEAKGAVAARLEEINKLTMDQVGIMAQYGVIANSQAARDEAAAERFKLNSAAALAEEIKKREGISASRQAEYEQATKLYLEFERMRLTNEGAPKPVTTPTGGGGGGGGDKDKPETLDELIARIGKENQAKIDAATKADEELAALKTSNDKLEQQLELDKMKLTLERNQAKNDELMASAQRAKDFEQKLEDEYTAAKHAAGELTEAEEEERDAARLQAVKDLAAAELGTYMQTAGKQLAIGKLSAKAAADMARSQLGNVIIGQGDKAMAEAGIMAAALNPLAIPMAAAGLAAYAIGNAMMPTVKQAGTTPATEKAEASAPAATNNYAFNMRVDSVFADGESVARQFAMMQESARQRGLLMQGA